jgi:hypothetical protein
MNQVSWPWLAPLSLKLEGARKILLLGTPLSCLRVDSDAEAIMARFKMLTESHAPDPKDRFYNPHPTDPPDAAPLYLYYAQVGAAIDSMYRSADLSELGRLVLDALCSVCKVGTCAPCVANVPPPANATCRFKSQTAEQDRKALQARGRCLQPAQEILIFCSGLAAQAYARHAPPLARGGIVWTTGRTTKPSGHTGVAVEGLTAEPSQNRNSARRTAHISFNIKDFFFSDYLALPYLAIHECVAHGHCGVALDDPDADESKAFHDGWMDTVAFTLFLDGLRQAAQQQPQHSVSRLAAEFSSRAEVVKAKRYDESHPAPVDVLHWQTGVRALESFSLLLAHALQELGICDLHESARIERELIDISIALNASDLTHLERQSLVDVLNRRYSRSSDAERRRCLEETPDGLRIVKNYLYEGRQDAAAMARAMLAI